MTDVGIPTPPVSRRLGAFRLQVTHVNMKKDRRMPPPAPVRTRSERSLLHQIMVRAVPKPTAAAIGYLDDSLLDTSDELTPSVVKYHYMEGMPIVANVLCTHWGNIATVILPRFQSEIFLDKAGLLQDLENAFKLCRALGVDTVALTGLIPSATGLGRDVERMVEASPEPLPQPTTGHATTTACMVLTLQKVLKEGGKTLQDEDVVFVGLGSVGLATLRLMLKVLPHPKSIGLCDVYSKQGTIADISREIREESHFKGTITALLADNTRQCVPDGVYNYGVLIGATNVPDLVEVDRLRPGTCVVDDSAPHCFDADAMIRRITTVGDVVATEGGPMRLTRPMEDHFFLPTRWNGLLGKETVGLPGDGQKNDAPAFDVGTKRDPREIMGCTFSPLLTALHPDLTPSIGPVGVEACAQHYHALVALGFTGCDLSLNDHIFPKSPMRYNVAAWA